MNTERLVALAEWFEGGAKHEFIEFDIRTGITIRKVEDADQLKNINTCKTACCIAGATVQFFNEPQQIVDRTVDFNGAGGFLRRDSQLPWYVIEPKATQLLGLSVAVAQKLFFPPGFKDQSEAGYDEYAIPADWAARTIRHLIATGRVDWEACREGMPA